MHSNPRAARQFPFLAISVSGSLAKAFTAAVSLQFNQGFPGAEFVLDRLDRLLERLEEYGFSTVTDAYPDDQHAEADCRPETSRDLDERVIALCDGEIKASLNIRPFQKRAVFEDFIPRSAASEQL